MGASKDDGRVVTRFAPSPTGFLHIGGARTALFNWLYARRHGGEFKLRIEDTDRARSTEPAIAAILDGMRWLGLDWDGEEIYQFARADRHAEVARALLASGHAYRCWLSQDELAAMREAARAERRPFRIRSPWRDRDPAEAPAGQPFVVRLKAPQDGETTIEDRVQGAVTVANAELDDFVMLRADGTPTYMLSVVVDDRDMGVTHVIRGDDHLNNAFRQLGVIRAMSWPEPVYAHVPMIHGPDGAKLSKRHGAMGVDAYRDALGILPEALDNYLMRLGWGHGDDEIFTLDQAVEWFDLDAVGKSPSRFDIKKLEYLNAHYIREADDAQLAALATPLIEAEIERQMTGIEPDLLRRSMAGLKPRARSINELASGALFLFRTRPLTLDGGAQSLLDAASRELLSGLRARLTGIAEWTEDALDAAVRGFAEEQDVKLGKVAQPMRAALTGQATSPGIFDVLLLLGREESLARIADQAG